MATFFAIIKSLGLLISQADMLQNNVIAKNGAKKTAAFRKRTIAPAKKAASITDHQGKN